MGRQHRWSRPALYKSSGFGRRVSFLSGILICLWDWAAGWAGVTLLTDAKLNDVIARFGGVFCGQEARAGAPATAGGGHLPLLAVSPLTLDPVPCFSWFHCC